VKNSTSSLEASYSEETSRSKIKRLKRGQSKQPRRHPLPSCLYGTILDPSSTKTLRKRSKQLRRHPRPSCLYGTILDPSLANRLCSWLTSSLSYPTLRGRICRQTTFRATSTRLRRCSRTSGSSCPPAKSTRYLLNKNTLLRYSTCPTSSPSCPLRSS